MTERDETGHLADERFLDALLERHHGPDRIAHEKRIASALAETVSAERGPSPGQRKSAWLKSASIVAAAILVAVTVFFWGGKEGSSARASLQQSIATMRESIDRRYDVTVVRRGVLSKRVDGELFVRGDSLLAVRLAVPTGDLWFGEGQNAAWLVPSIGPLAFVNERGSILDRIAPGQVDFPLPILRITSILTRIGDGYDLAESRKGDHRVLDARLVRPNGDLSLPSRTRLEIAPDGVVVRLAMHWEDLRSGRPRALYLEHAGSEPLPSNFYEHTAHHRGRWVIDRR